MKTFGGAVALGVLCASSWAGTPQTWPFNIATTGSAVSWVSPTPVNGTRPQFEASYTITQFLVNVRFGIFNLGPIDVTGQVPPEQLSNASRGPGPAPATFFNDAVIYPPPPETPGFVANVVVALNASGFGTLDLTNVVLGPLLVDLGPPFGLQTVTLTRVQAIGTVTVDPIPCPADLDGDGFVGSPDLAALLGAWNAIGGTADLNLDDAVNAGDLAAMLGAWGTCPP